MRNKIVVGPAEYDAIFARCAKVGKTLTTRPDVSSVRAGIAAALNELVEVGVDAGRGVLKGNYDHGGTFVYDRASKGIQPIWWACWFCDFHVATTNGKPGDCPVCGAHHGWDPMPLDWRPPAPDTTRRLARDRHRRSGWFKPKWPSGLPCSWAPGKGIDWIKPVPPYKLEPEVDSIAKVISTITGLKITQIFPTGSMDGKLLVGFTRSSGYATEWVGGARRPNETLEGAVLRLVREKCTSSQDGGAQAAASPSASSKSQATPENSSSSAAATSQGHASSKGKSAKGRPGRSYKEGDLILTSVFPKVKKKKGRKR